MTTLAPDTFGANARRDLEATLVELRRVDAARLSRRAALDAVGDELASGDLIDKITAAACDLVRAVTNLEGVAGTVQGALDSAAFVAESAAEAVGTVAACEALAAEISTGKRALSDARRAVRLDRQALRWTIGRAEAVARLEACRTVVDELTDRLADSVTQHREAEAALAEIDRCRPAVAHDLRAADPAA